MERGGSSDVQWKTVPQTSGMRQETAALYWSEFAATAVWHLQGTEEPTAREDRWHIDQYIGQINETVDDRLEYRKQRRKKKTLHDACV